MDVQTIKTQLKSNKITYEQLSAKSGIPLNTLKNIFSGRTPNPRIDTMQAIEEALELNQKPNTATETVNTQQLSEREQELLTAFRSSNTTMQDYIIQIVKNIPKNS